MAPLAPCAAEGSAMGLEWPLVPLVRSCKRKHARHSKAPAAQAGCRCSAKALPWQHRPQVIRQAGASVHHAMHTLRTCMHTPRACMRAQAMRPDIHACTHILLTPSHAPPVPMTDLRCARTSCTHIPPLIPPHANDGPAERERPPGWRAQPRRRPPGLPSAPAHNSPARCAATGAGLSPPCQFLGPLRPPRACSIGLPSLCWKELVYRNEKQGLNCSCNKV